MFKRNLSKPRFILYLSVVLFMLLILVIQFIVLSVYRVKAQHLQERMDELEREINKPEPDTDSTSFLSFVSAYNGEEFEINI